MNQAAKSTTVHVLDTPKSISFHEVILGLPKDPVNCIPEGVTITNVTDAGVITLSESVTVEPAIAQPTHIENRFTP